MALHFGYDRHGTQECLGNTGLIKFLSRELIMKTMPVIFLASILLAMVIGPKMQRQSGQAMAGGAAPDPDPDQ